MSGTPAQIVFWDAERGREDRYDFISLGLPADTARSFAAAFRVITGGYRAGSRQQAWLRLRRFSRFLTQDPTDPLAALSDPNVLLRYKQELLKQKVLLKTAGSHYNSARQLVRWLVEHDSEGPWRFALLFRGPSMLTRERHNVRDNDISPQLLQRIASICKHQVDAIIERFSVRERVLRGEEVSETELGGMRLKDLREVLALEARCIYTQLDFGRIHRGRLAAIGLRRAEPYRALTNRTALPYYVLLIITTCGNPIGIKDLTIDCLEPHPTDPLKRRISWNKYRSHGEQAYDVLANGRYSAARCVADLLRLTEPIRPLTPAADAQKLLITRTGRRSKRLAVQSLHNVLAVFRTEHKLPYFTFADLRKAAAAAVDEYTKSARVVKKVLQHRSARTSWVYLQARRSVDRRYEGVLQF